ALDQLEHRGFGALPDLFAKPANDQERRRLQAYLEDVAVGSVDLLLERASPPARRLLWLIGLAGEPVGRAMVEGVWSGRSQPATLLIGPILDELRGAGLLSVSWEGPGPAGADSPTFWTAAAGKGAEGANFGVHELVRERADAWMNGHPGEREGRTAEQVW